MAPLIPSTISQRLDGYDLARALAVFGMLLVNFDAFADPAGNDPLWLRSIIDWIEGKAAVTFVVLAGIGISLKTRSARLTNDSFDIRHQRRHLLRRGLVLVSGGILFSLTWPADILLYYGVYMALGAVLFSSSNRCLLLTAALVVTTSALLFTFIDPDQGWDLNTSTITDFWTPAGIMRSLFFNGYYPVFPWFAFLLLGVWIGRLDISLSKIKRSLTIAGAIALVSAETAAYALTEWLMNHPTYLESERFLRWADIDPWTPLPLFVLSGAGTAILTVAFCSRASEPVKESRMHRSFLAAGRMSLTVYVSHILVGYGLAHLVTPEAGFQLEEVAGVAVFYYAGSLVFCTLWSRRFGKGPLERLLQMLVSVRVILPFNRKSFIFDN